MADLKTCIIVHLYTYTYLSDKHAYVFIQTLINVDMLFHLPMVCLTQYKCTKKGKFINRIFVLMCWWMGLCARVAYIGFCMLHWMLGKLSAQPRKFQPPTPRKFWCLFTWKNLVEWISLRKHTTLWMVLYAPTVLF